MGALLADTLDADEPRFFPEAVWTACVDDPALFAQPLAPLREIADHHGLAHRGDWLAPAGFDFDAWDLDRGCALLASRHDLDPDDAFALFMLIKLHEQMELTLLSVDPDEPLKDAVPGAAEDATQPGTDPFIELGGQLGAALADPLLAQLLVAETVDTDPAGAAALGLFAEVLEPKVPRAARVALRWLRAVAYDRTGDIDAAERELLAAESDAVLFEGGAFEEFLQARGSLLPDDERLLAQQWLLLERSVFEVEQVRPGQGVTVRDVRTGDTHEVVERTASRQLQRGQLICTRAVPAGDSMVFFGGIEPVALHERDPLIELLDDEPDPVTLVAQLTLRFAPPRLVNTEGDPMAICEASVRVGDAAGICVALDEVYDWADGEETPRWFEHVVTDGLQRIHAALVLDGDTLSIETNSEQRMDRVLATLARLDPAMTVLDDERRPLRDTREATELSKQMPITGEGALDPYDPEVAAFLGEFIRDYETRWLDEPIPALDGYTPRQAADDPTRRGDLIKLLDSFPAGAAARGGMDADRLREALGLR